MAIVIAGTEAILVFPEAAGTAVLVTSPVPATGWRLETLWRLYASKETLVSFGATSVV